MSLIIDTNGATPRLLRIYAQMLDDFAGHLEQTESIQERPLPIALPVPAGTPAASDPIHAGMQPPPPAVDAKGMPWDERIHSSNKALCTDGTWRQRRGVATQLVANVEAELRAKVASGGTPPQAAAIAPPVTLPPGGLSPPQVPLPTGAASPVPVPPPAVTVPQPVPSVPVASPVSVPTPPAAGGLSADAIGAQFNGIMQKFNSLGRERGWTPDVLTKACKQSGLIDINDLLTADGAARGPNVLQWVEHYAAHGVS